MTGAKRLVTKYGSRTLWVAMPLLLAANRTRPAEVAIACGVAALGLMHRRYASESDAIVGDVRRLIRS